MASASGLFSSVPAGAMLSYGGATAPAGWLLCYGQAVSRTTYAALFAAISTTYGVGDGSTTFNLPDLRGRAVFGKDDMGGSGANRLLNTGIDGTVQNPVGTTLGATGGSDRRALGFVGARGPVADGSTGTLWTTLDGISVEEGAISAGAENSSNVPPAIVLSYIIKT